MALLAIVALIAGFTGSMAAEPTKPGPSPAPVRTDSLVNQRVELLLKHLQAARYAEIVAMFDARMKEAVPEEKLRSLWEQTAPLGRIQSWNVTDAPDVRGHAVRVAIVRLERAEFHATVSVDRATGWVTGLFLKPAPSPATSASYVDSTTYHSIATTVGGDSLPLSGTLLVPVGRGPFPAAILVHGSGPQDRDETVGPNRIFKDLAEGLASRGVAVLRYDKRTRQYPDRKPLQVTMEYEVIDDAVLAVRRLRDRAEIDTSRLYVIGHSLGALLAPEIGVRSRAAGAVLLAPPGRPPWELVRSQMRALEAPAAEIAEVEQKIAKLQAGTLGEEMFLGAPASYWKDWAGRDGVAMAKKLRRPLLILRGDRDIQVGQVDIDVWKRGLTGQPNVEFATIPSLNHFFLPGTGKPSQAEYTIPNHVPQSVIETLAAFIQRPRR